MQMFVFEYLEQVSKRYHSEGGLVVIAKDREHVEELIKDNEYIEITESEWKNVITYPIGGRKKVNPTYYVFPDAGCC